MGRPDIDRIVETYRSNYRIDTFERDLPAWAAASQNVLQHARSRLGAMGALLGLPAAAAVLVNKAADLHGAGVLVGVAAAVVVLIAVLASPFGRSMTRELPQVLGVSPRLGLQRKPRLTIILAAAGAVVLLAALLAWLAATDRVDVTVLAAYAALILSPLVAVGLAWHRSRSSPPPR
jgi:hypothetical protein